jgi:hypothetical protein
MFTGRQLAPLSALRIGLPTAGAYSAPLAV